MEKLSQVLLIDDNEIDNLVHTKLMNEAKLADQIIAFTNSRSALIHLKEQVRKDIHNLPDVVLLDLYMPMMDGWSFIQEYAKLGLHEYKKIDLYIISCSIFNKEINKLKNDPQVVDYIPKPLTTNKFVDIKRRFLSQLVK